MLVEGVNSLCLEKYEFDWRGKLFQFKTLTFATCEDSDGRR